MKKLQLFLVFGLVMSCLVFAEQATISPAACSGQWSNCKNAFADDASSATAKAGGSSYKIGSWSSYAFSLPSDAAIDSIKVRVDSWATNSRGKFKVRVSSDGGDHWGSWHIFGGNTAEKTTIIDVTADRDWTVSKLNGGKLKVEVKCFESSSGSDPTCKLDWVPVIASFTKTLPALFDISINPASATVSQSSAGTNVTHNSAGTATFSHSGCPPDSSCSFTTSFENNLEFRVSTGLSTPAGVYPITIKGTEDSTSAFDEEVFTVTKN